MSLTDILLLVAALAMALAAFQLFDDAVGSMRIADRVRRATASRGEARQDQSIAALGGELLRQLAVAGFVNALASPQDRMQVERILTPRGVPLALAAPLLVAVKLVFLIGGPLMGLLYHTFMGGEGGNPLLYAVMGLAGGILVPSMLLSRLRKRHIESLNRGLSDAFDLLVVCAEAGLGLETAIDRVAKDLRQASPAIAIEFAQLAQEMRMLPDRTVAMERFAQRAEVEGLKRLAATLSQATRYGTPLGQALRALAGDQRNERMMRLEAKAQRLPALLVMPLILFILPPLFIIIGGPNFLRLGAALTFK